MTEMARGGTNEWVKDHTNRYIRSGGVEGHIMDITDAGGRDFSTHCLIRFAGRKTGRVQIRALCYGAIGGETVIVASKGGADDNPQWLLNIMAAETVDFQIATQAYRAKWRIAEGAEREKIWNYMIDCFPFYAVYQTRTTRILPLVVLTAIESIPVFKKSDITPRTVA